MSQESIEDLYERWQKNPDTAETTALCKALRGGLRPDLVEIVGSHASKQADLGALLAAARMYVDAGRLDDAQSVLLTAGRIAPRDGEVYRWLGEVLLLRGDAGRAQKVLEKAVQFGSDNGAGPLLERARALAPVQRASGQGGLADGIAKPSSPSSKQAAAADSDEDVATVLRKDDDVRAAIEAGLAPLSKLIPAAGGPPSARVPSAQNAIFFDKPTRELGFDTSSQKEQTRESVLSSPSLGDLVSNVAPHSVGANPAAASTASFGSSNRRSANDGLESARARDAAGSRRGHFDPPVNPLFFDAPAPPLAPLGGARVPEPRDVLDALQIAGIYEPGGAVNPQIYTWNKPERVRRLFSMFTLVGLAVVLVASGFGIHSYVTSQRAKAHLVAEQLLASVDRELQASDPRRLEIAEKMISKSFELESRSPHAALDWLHERALVGLLKGGADLAFEDSVQRAKAVGIEEKKVAFAYVASFLFQGDTAGSAATVAKWDAIAHDDPWFQLLAGATFERAGDPRAIERYGFAVKLDPELLIAQVLLARAVAVESDHRRGVELANEFRLRHPDRAEGAALVVLAWTRDPLHSDPPAEVKYVTETDDPLPIALRSVPHAARAILALHRGAVDEARPSLQKGLDVVDTPGVAAWLGNIALVMGDENLARKAALAAVSFSAVYPPARVLAARVALLGARLDEALKATEDLPPSSLDVAIVTAAASYEKLDADRMARAFEATPGEAKKLPFALPLLRGQSLLSGHLTGITAEEAVDMADDEAPWSDLVAMDWVLDAGELDMAKKIADQWRGEPRALRAIRLARLSRYEGRLEDAEKYSRIALESGTVTMRALTERVLTLVALKKDAEALALFKSYPNVGGPLAKWLRAYATAAHGKIDDARAIVAQEDPPPAAAAMPARIIAALAFAMMKNVRYGTEYTKSIVQAGFANPDVALAAERLGIGKVVRRGKP